MSSRHYCLRQKVCEHLACTDQSSFHIEFDRLLYFFFVHSGTHQCNTQVVFNRSRRLTFQRELSRGGLCTTNLFPRFKSQRTSNFVGGWCSCFVCARLHQSVRHSRRTDSMSRRVGVPARIVTSCVVRGTQNHNRVQSTVGKSVRHPPHHAVAILMRTTASKALCAIFPHVSST